MKLVALVLFCSGIFGLAEDQDPRAVSIIRQRGIEEEGKSTYLREESVYSIVVFGAPDSTGDYRILGLDQTFKIDELTLFLNAFYGGFPKKAKIPDERLGGLVPLPNILYASGGWNEVKEDGRSLAAKFSEKYGVALYYFSTTPGYAISAQKEPGLPHYPTACIDLYQRRLKLIAAMTKEQREQAGADQPAAAPESNSEGKEKAKPESEARSQ
jgi:hypothetical protein